MELIKFKKELFEDKEHWPKGWHLMNTAAGQQGEYTLCGVAFDGDATREGVFVEPEYKNQGKVTCVNCLAIIKMCKAIKL